MTVLASVEAENFCQFASFKVRLKRIGLTWVGGDNRDTEGAACNGSGKTNLLNAIGWCLFDEFPEPTPADNVIRDGEAKAWVEVKTDDGWTFRRERTRGTPRFTISFNDEQLKLSKNELKDKVVEIVGYDWQGWLNAVYYAQGDASRFIRPRTSDADRKRILHRFLRTDVDEAREWVKKQANELKLRLAEQEGKLSAAQAALGELDLKELKNDFDEWESRRLQELKEAREELERARTGFRSEAAAVRHLKALRKERRKRKAELEQQIDLQAEAGSTAQVIAEDLSAKTASRNTLAGNLRAEELFVSKRSAELDKLEALNKCPTCLSTISKGEAAEHIRSDRKKIEEAKQRAKKLRLQLKEADLVIAQLRLDLEKAAEAASTTEQEKELAVIEAWLEGYSGALAPARARAKDFAVDIQNRSRELKERKREVNPFAKRIEEARGKRTELKAARRLARQNVAELSDELAYYEWWKRGYSPSGFPSYMLDWVMPFLTERANHYLETLSDGDITVNFSTQRELASSKGQFREEIGITWEIEGVSQYNPSGGQWRKMEIATDLALMDLAAQSEAGSVDLLILDEILDGLDPVGRQRLTRLLLELRSVRGSILVVSHDADIAEVFERSVTVVKEGGVSRVEVR